MYNDLRNVTRSRNMVDTDQIGEMLRSSERYLKHLKKTIDDLKEFNIRARKFLTNPREGKG